MWLFWGNRYGGSWGRGTDCGRGWLSQDGGLSDVLGVRVESPGGVESLEGGGVRF